MDSELLKNVARMVDISGVRADVTLGELNQIVAAAKHYRFICAFAMPCFTPRLVEMLRDEPDIMVGGTVGFPSGADTTQQKVFGTREQLAAGVHELDMVINIGALKSGLNELVYNDIRAVVDAAEGKPTKCILEIAYLTDDEIRRGAELAVRAGVAFVKTGTGWAGKPTTVETIRIIRQTIGNAARIKAAGGGAHTGCDARHGGCRLLALWYRPAQHHFHHEGSGRPSGPHGRVLLNRCGRRYILITRLHL